jgi:hypothetical protein
MEKLLVCVEGKVILVGWHQENSFAVHFQFWKLNILGIVNFQLDSLLVSWDLNVLNQDSNFFGEHILWVLRQQDLNFIAHKIREYLLVLSHGDRSQLLSCVVYLFQNLQKLSIVFLHINIWLQHLFFRNTGTSIIRIGSIICLQLKLLMHKSGDIHLAWCWPKHLSFFIFLLILLSLRSQFGLNLGQSHVWRRINLLEGRSRLWIWLGHWFCLKCLLSTKWSRLSWSWFYHVLRNLALNFHLVLIWNDLNFILLRCENCRSLNLGRI